MQRKLGKLTISPQSMLTGINTTNKGICLDEEIREFPQDDSSEPNSEPEAIFDIEPNKGIPADALSTIPLRTRYYHSLIDARSLKRGKKNTLSSVYVIMIMNFDPWKMNRLICTVRRSVCEDQPGKRS